MTANRTTATRQTEKFNPMDIFAGINFSGINKHPNILIAARFWEKDRYEAAKVCYQFMRRIDDMIDDRKAYETSLTDCEKQIYANQVNDWIECLHGKPLNDPFFEEVVTTINNYRIPLHLFHEFAKSMIYDINHDGFDTFEDFLNYAEGASVVPASVFVHLCCLNEAGSAYVYPSMDLMEIARPCAIFSYLVHIIRDFQADQQNNLNYFAKDILQQNDLTPADLKNISNRHPIPDNFRKVISEYMAIAEFYRQQTEKTITRLAPFLSQRYLLSLKIIYKLYLLAFKRINATEGNFTTGELNPVSEEMKKHVLSIIWRPD